MESTLSTPRLFSLSRDDALHDVSMISEVASGWKEHFRASGVTAGDIG